MARSLGPNGFAKEPERASNCASFASSFGLSGEIDGADGANEADIVRESMDRGIFVCQAFSKVLIVRAIVFF